jgi:hypothetical protein
VAVSNGMYIELSTRVDDPSIKLKSDGGSETIKKSYPILNPTIKVPGATGTIKPGKQTITPVPAKIY